MICLGQQIRSIYDLKSSVAQTARTLKAQWLLVMNRTVGNKRHAGHRHQMDIGRRAANICLVSKMTEPILDPNYWRKRLKHAKERHRAIFRCSLERWHRIEEKHRKILANRIKDTDKILDAGCGWGRLLDLMPRYWHGDYLGIDISPDFVRLAEKNHPGRSFLIGDLRNVKEAQPVKIKFDWAILISIKQMVINNLGVDAWDEIEVGLRRMAHGMLILEYDENSEGSVE